MTTSRIPLNTLAIAFGLAGLADTWSTAGEFLHWPVEIGAAFWIVAAIAWVWLITAHLQRGRSSGDSLAGQLRHPAQGPLGALVPVVAMLLGIELYEFVPVAGVVVYLVAMLAMVVFAAWLLSFWMRGNLVADAVHGGYFLPVVAGPLIASTGAATVGLTGLAYAALAMGLLFWVVMFIAIMARLALRPALPAPLVPTIAIFLAPPAVAGGAWFEINGHVGDPLAYAFAGLTVLTLLVELALIPLYRRIGFSLGFWSFTFPLAAAARLGIDWLAIAHPLGWQVASIALVAIVTAAVLAVALGSLRLVTESRAKAERQLLNADNRAAI